MYICTCIDKLKFNLTTRRVDTTAHVASKPGKRNSGIRKQVNSVSDRKNK